MMWLFSGVYGVNMCGSSRVWYLWSAHDVAVLRFRFHGLGTLWQSRFRDKPQYGMVSECIAVSLVDMDQVGLEFKFDICIITVEAAILAASGHCHSSKP